MIPLTRELAASLPEGAEVVNANDETDKRTLSNPGIDRDGDFYLSLGGYSRWTAWALPDDSPHKPAPPPRMTKAQALEALQSLKSQHERLIARLLREAEDREWCDEFDRVMADVGIENLRETPKDWRVSYRAMVEWTLTIEGERNEEGARDEASGFDFGSLDYIRDDSNEGRGARISNVEIVSVEPTS